MPPFRTGVSLHSHTLHSRESMEFIGRVTHGVPWLSAKIREQREAYRRIKGRELDLSRAWWTPPLSARQAVDVERGQIERMGFEGLVSLTDHDNIDAGLQLQIFEDTRNYPISVEWTVPFRQTFFHVGIHNMPADSCVEMMRSMQEFTAQPAEARIAPMLEWLGSAPGSLIVLNHPLWDENHIGADAHEHHARAFMSVGARYIHAFELNGLRPWKENRRVIQFANELEMPLISGGDRHAREPNACVNLTNAGSFAEFADEIRTDGWSDVCFMPQYRETFRMRIVLNMCDILEEDPNHSRGWRMWHDRVFFLSDEGIEKSLPEMLTGGFPPVINQFVALVKYVRHPGIRSALRLALGERQEFAI